MWAKVKQAIPWVLALLALAYTVKAEIRQRAALKSAQDQIAALQHARDEVADMEGEQKIDQAQETIKDEVKRAVDSSDLDTFIRDRINDGSSRQGATASRGKAASDKNHAP